MEQVKEILTVEVPKDSTLYDWALGDGKKIVFPELLIGCEELLYHNLKKVCCLKVITYENGRDDKVEFIVRKKGINHTLKKINEWALESERYLMCHRISILQDYLKGIKNET